MTYTPEHTTAEYLAWIDERIAKLNEVINNPCAWGIETEIEYRASLLANRDVLVRHESDSQGCCSTCGKYGSVMFPCKTATDILQRIAEVM